MGLSQRITLLLTALALGTIIVLGINAVPAVLAMVNRGAIPPATAMTPVYTYSKTMAAALKNASGTDLLGSQEQMPLSIEANDAISRPIVTTEATP